MMQTFAVTVPPGVGPGQQFQASLDGQLTMVIVPHGSGPSSTLHVQIPVRPSSVQKYAVTIPQNVQPGGRFQANLGGQLVWLSCPRNLGPGKQMLVDANSANASNGNAAKSWPPPIAVPEALDDDDVPEYFLCPITGCIMRQPAMTPEGVTYDYDALVEWLSSKQTDPSTNLPLTPDQLCPNRTVRSMIEDFIAKGPNFSFHPSEAAARPSGQRARGSGAVEQPLPSRRAPRSSSRLAPPRPFVHVSFLFRLVGVHYARARALCAKRGFAGRAYGAAAIRALSFVTSTAAPEL